MVPSQVREQNGAESYAHQADKREEMRRDKNHSSAKGSY
jgi:hypothetical protein